MNDWTELTLTLTLVEKVWRLPTYFKVRKEVERNWWIRELRWLERIGSDCVLKSIESNIVWLARDNELESSAIIETVWKMKRKKKRIGSCARKLISRIQDKLKKARANKTISNSKLERKAQEGWIENKFERGTHGLDEWRDWTRNARGPDQWRVWTRNARWPERRQWRIKSKGAMSDQWQAWKWKARSMPE